MIRALVILATVLSWGLAHAADQAVAPLSFVAGKLQVSSAAASLGLHCAYSANDTATLRAALESGGAAAGKTLFIPSGCKILLGTPGSGDSVADVASNTTIECEDQTAGFVLARKSCSDASNTPGAACTADNQCKSGTCDPDYAAGTSFAPTAADTYTIFGAASGTENIAIRNCSIWTNAASGDTPAMGGAGKRWGYCDGGGTSVAGEGCYNACNSSSGAYEGLACLANTDCNAGGAGTPGSCVAVAGNCKSLGGSCGSIPYSTNAGAAGPGKINPINWANATNARVENVAIYDLRRGDAAINIGTGGVVTDSTTTANSLTTAQVSASILGSNSWLIGTGRHTCSFLSTYTGCQTPTLAKGIVSNGATIVRSTGYGWTAGIQAKANTHLIHSTGGGYGDPSQTGWNGNADLLISGSNVQADNFVGGTSLYCVLPEFAVGYNFQVSQPYCDNNIGPKFIVQNAGNQYLGVRGAWSGRGAIVGLSDQRGRCTGGTGTRTGKVCVFGAGDDATIGCPTGGTCAADDAFPAGPANHFILAGGGLLHSDQGSTVTFLRAPDSKRCTNPGATDYGGPCSSDGDCSTGLCDYLYWVNGLIDGTLFYNGTGTTAVDLSTTGVGVSKTTASPSISNWVVSGVDLQGFSTGFKFPSISRSCVSGSNDGTSCTADATCTGGGKCKAQVENFVASGNVGTTTTPLLNWDWSYGDVSGLKGLLATDDQGTVITLTAGEALTRGQLVSVSTSTDNAVVKTTTANPERGLGVALADTLSGYRAKVLTQGIGACIADGTISNGDQLKPSGSTSGRVVTISSTADPIVGRALDSATSGQTFDCLVGTAPPIQNSSAIFPKFAESHSTGTTSGVICSSATALATITYTATSGHLVRLQGYVPLDITGSVTRVFTTFITRGGSSCTAGSPTTLVTADSELTSNQNITAAIAYTDTGQSGSVTYRLCFCADTAASCQAGANAALLLTEY